MTSNALVTLVVAKEDECLWVKGWRLCVADWGSSMSACWITRQIVCLYGL